MGHMHQHLHNILEAIEQSITILFVLVMFLIFKIIWLAFSLFGKLRAAKRERIGIQKDLDEIKNILREKEGAGD